MLKCVAVCCRLVNLDYRCCRSNSTVAVCGSMLPCVAVSCSALRIRAPASVLQRVLQCVYNVFAVCCSVCAHTYACIHTGRDMCIHTIHVYDMNESCPTYPSYDMNESCPTYPSVCHHTEYTYTYLGICDINTPSIWV